MWPVHGCKGIHATKSFIAPRKARNEHATEELTYFFVVLDVAYAFDRAHGVVVVVLRNEELPVGMPDVLSESQQ